MAPCVSRSIAAGMVTTPVLASIVNRPSGVAGQAVGDRVVRRVEHRTQSAVMPTVVPMIAFSVTSSVAPSTSVTGP